ncbi:MAG: AAA-like domain-containing protein [Microcoleaceae cyanobacterium]
MVARRYQVGGCLSNDNPHYVERDADVQLHTALRQGEFCYVLNSRQMGKSSLLVRIKRRLEQQGYVCATLDMTSLVSEETTSAQWYKGIVAQLWLELNLLGTFNVKSWWQSEAEFSALQRLGRFFAELLLTHFPQQNLFILIDEIDSILRLPFKADDFFSLIRYCYNQRAINPEYHRINFAVFGVAAPADLIQNRTLNPFNIGQSIELHGFRETEVAPLAQGLAEYVQKPEALLQEILNWTQGQPFLTQKLCQIVWQLSQSKISDGKLALPPGTEPFWIEQVIRSHMIDRWETQDEPEHLRTIRDRLLDQKSPYMGRILALYQHMLYGLDVEVDDSREQIELLLSGLVVRHQGRLQVKNPIYQEVFNLEWVKRQLAKLRPYSQTFDAWIVSNQRDHSRLLRGQALQDAQYWAQGKSLSDLDYQFIVASQELDWQEKQTALEAERTKEVLARLRQEQKVSRLQRSLLGMISTAFVIVGGLGLTIFYQYRNAQLSEIQAIALSSEALLASGQKLEALVEALKAKQKLDKLPNVDPKVQASVTVTLRKALYQTEESNRLIGHQKAVWDVAFSPDGRYIATAGGDNMVKLWQSNGKFLRTLKAHQGPVWGVVFSPDSQTLASGSWDNTVKLWTIDGQLERTLSGHTAGVWSVAFSPDGQFLVSASEDKTLKLWNRSGQLQNTLTGHTAGIWRVAFRPDSQQIASASEDGTVRLWSLKGNLEQTLQGHQGPVWGVAYSPRSSSDLLNRYPLVSVGDDKTIRLWEQGQLKRTLTGHQAAIWSAVFSPDGKTIATASWDRTVKFWSLDGTLLRTLEGHQERLRGLAFSPNGEFIASSSEDKTVKLWQLQHPLITTLRGHTAGVIALAVNSKTQQIISGSDDQTLKLWKFDGTLLATLRGHTAGVLGVGFSVDGQQIVSASWDKTVKLWTAEGKLQQTLVGHNGPVWDAQFSPDGRLIASADRDGLIKLWQIDPQGKFQNTKTFKGHQNEIRAIAFSPDGQLFASASLDRALKIWTRSGTLLHTLTGHRDGVADVAFNPRGDLIASASLDGTIRLWSRTGLMRETFIGHRDGTLGVAFSPDGQMLVSAGLDRTLKLWSRSGTLLKTLYRHESAIWQVKFDRTGNVLASAGEDQSIHLWNLKQILSSDESSDACVWLRNYLASSNAEQVSQTCPRQLLN